MDSGYPDMSEAINSMAILCDNVYRRIKDPSCSAAVSINLDKAGNLMRISQTQIDSGTFEPTSIIAGEFTIFARMKGTTIKKASVVVEHDDFVGQYKFHSRTLNDYEKALVPKLPEWYIIPQEVVDICKHAKETTGKSMQMRNFLLRGPAGTGKTMSAKAIAAGMNLPYMAYTCSQRFLILLVRFFRIRIPVLQEMLSLIMREKFLKVWVESIMRMYLN